MPTGYDMQLLRAIERLARAVERLAEVAETEMNTVLLALSPSEEEDDGR